VKNGAIGYVAGHRVVGQRIEDGVLYATVEMTVKEDPMAEDLQSLRATLLRKGDPRIAILVTDMADSAFGVDLPPTTDAEPTLLARDRQGEIVNSSEVIIDIAVQHRRDSHRGQGDPGERESPRRITSNG
jgi:hypothetical protein